MTRQQSLPEGNWSVRLARTMGWDQLLAGWRRLAGPVAQGDMTLSSSATINAQLWFSQFPLRPTAGWAVVAAVLASGWLLQPQALDWRELALLFLLTDPLWGSIWRLAAGRLELLPLREPDVRRSVWLPYLEAGSPAARLLGWDDNGVLHLVLRVVLPTVAMALAIALVLGPTAVWLTGAVVVLALTGWTVRHSIGYIPAILHSAVTVALPWMLTLIQLGLTREHAYWSAHLGMVIIWFLHNWGEGRVLRSARDWLGIGLLAVADMGIGLLLILARAPLPLALMSILWLPTWLLIYQQRPLARLNFWWLVGMLLSGLALGQSL